MATAELAIVIPAVLLVLAMCLTGLSLAVDQIRCVDAARAAARAASRGEDIDTVRQIAVDLTPSGTTITVSEPHRGGEEVEVRVEAPRRPGLLPGLPSASSTARAPVEPAVNGAG
ncbi:MAG: TadE family type IV pilus minor pilin [Ornithinimicrobium sp.]